MKNKDRRAAYRRWIRANMASKGINARELSVMAGLSHAYVRGIISGAYTFKKGREKVEKALGMKIWSDPEIGVDREAGQ